MIRHAKESDCGYLHHLYKELDIGGQPLVTPTCISLLQSNPLYKILICEQDNLPVGTITTYVCPDPSTARFFGIIDYLSVLPSYRRKGIAKSLINEAENFCKLKGCYAIKVITKIDNIKALNLYKSAGYSSSDRVTLRKNL